MALRRPRADIGIGEYLLLDIGFTIAAAALAVIRWLRFNAVGIAGVAVQLAVLWLLARLGAHYPLAANLLAIALTSLLGFFLGDRWVFARAR